MNQEAFIKEMSKRWRLFKKYAPRKAETVFNRLSPSSPMFVAKNKSGFMEAIYPLLEAENNPEIFQFLLENGWKLCRDLILLASISPY